MRLDDLLERGVGAHRDRALGDDHLVGVQQFADFLADLHDVFQVGFPGFGHGGLHGDEDHVGILHALGQAGGELQPVLFHVFQDQTVQTRLVKGDDALDQSLDAFLVDVHAGHLVAEVGHAGTRHQTDVTRAHHADSNH